MKDADLIISNSEFFRDLCVYVHGRNSEIIYPPIDVKKFIAKNKKPEYITLIKPIPSKGVDVFIEMAKRFPKEQFLAVGGKNEKLNAMPNVKVLDWTSDLANDVYARTKIMLIPSRVNESFGRMAVEAMANGIPCIATDRGGVADIVDGVWPKVHPDDYDMWEKQLGILLTDKKIVNEGVRKGKVKIKKYDYKKQLTKLEKIVRRFK
jgi:glycosyltransferase involved in cell wall biosynthesis